MEPSLSAARSRSRARDFVSLLRPDHWVKNLFVLAGVFFAGSMGDGIWVRALLALFGFCLLASGIYAFNDICDRDKDAAHPTKRNRPIASGRVSVATARWLAGGCWLGGVLLLTAVSKAALTAGVAYVVLNLAYSLKLKHVVLLDVFSISGGFLLRLLAGTVGLGIAPSPWLLVCGLMLTLFLGFVKRRAEWNHLDGAQAGNRRRVLDNYTPELLDNLTAITATCSILSYTVYTVSPQTTALHHTEDLVYTVPIVTYGFFRVLYLLHRWKQGENASRELFMDKHIVATGLFWLLAFYHIVSTAT